MQAYSTQALRNGLFCLLLPVLLSACGDRSAPDSKATALEKRTVAAPVIRNGKLLLTDPATGKLVPLIGIPYQTGKQGSTSKTGNFPYQNAQTVTFKLFNVSIGPIPAQAVINENDLAVAFCKAASNVVQCQYATAKNLQRLLLSVDNDLQATNGITIPSQYRTGVPTEFSRSIDEFELSLGQYLNKTNRKAASLFQPSLAINLEAAQPEADEVGGQPLPFADLFRIVRPFPEYSCTDITYDANGWPLTIPASCDTQINAVFKTPTWATTTLLRYVPTGAIPTGKYTVLYEGSGDLQYSGIASKLAAESTPGRDVIEITPALIASRGAAGLRIQLKNTDPLTPVKNIRVVMPGGICAGNPFVRVDDASGCGKNRFQSFTDTLAADRNSIVFNPDYLRFLKDFKVIRTMNLMEASPRNACYIYTDDAYRTCLTQAFNWEQRATMGMASWGGSARTPLLQRYARGVPLEVVVELANQLERAPWFNLPHNASDDYVTQYARYVRDHLKPELKAHLEYSNEPWNGIFWAALYVREQGKELDSNPYRAGYKYYSNRAVEIFQLWANEFGGTDRLVRILNTYNPDEWMSRNMLAYNGNFQYVDALASAPYFQGCWDRSSNTTCQDPAQVPLVMKDVTSVDDVFAVLDNTADPYGLAAALRWSKVQQQVAAEFNLPLYSYEGGQHLVINWSDATLTTERKDNLLNLMRAANRDIRMAGRYSQFLNGWKAAGGELFTLYTLPQTYHRFGTFGIKEHLNQARFDAPKYDMSMQFQEAQGKCWWEGCE